jgi:hypothetical protein
VLNEAFESGRTANQANPAGIGRDQRVDRHGVMIRDRDWPIASNSEREEITFVVIIQQLTIDFRRWKIRGHIG